MNVSFVQLIDSETYIANYADGRNREFTQDAPVNSPSHLIDSRTVADVRYTNDDQVHPNTEPVTGLPNFINGSDAGAHLIAIQDSPHISIPTYSNLTNFGAAGDSSRRLTDAEISQLFTDYICAGIVNPADLFPRHPVVDNRFTELAAAAWGWNGSGTFNGSFAWAGGAATSAPTGWTMQYTGTAVDTHADMGMRNCPTRFGNWSKRCNLYANYYPRYDPGRFFLASFFCFAWARGADRSAGESRQSWDRQAVILAEISDAEPVGQDESRKVGQLRPVAALSGAFDAGKTPVAPITIRYSWSLPDSGFRKGQIYLIGVTAAGVTGKSRQFLLMEDDRHTLPPPFLTGRHALTPVGDDADSIIDKALLGIREAQERKTRV